MPLFKKWNAGGGIVGIWKVEESLEDLLALLSDADVCRQEMEKMKSESRRMEYVAVRVLLRQLLGEELHIAHEPSGKPYLVEQTYHLSISHTKGYVAVALHRHLCPGVDIEYYADRVKKVTSRFVRQDEQAGIDRYEGTPYIYMLLLHWSAKETMYKVMEENEVDFVDHLRIMPFDLSESGSFAVCEYRTPQKENFQISYMIHPDFVCTWCMKSVNY